LNQLWSLITLLWVDFEHFYDNCFERLTVFFAFLWKLKPSINHKLLSFFYQFKKFHHQLMIERKLAEEDPKKGDSQCPDIALFTVISFWELLT